MLVDVVNTKGCHNQGREVDTKCHNGGLSRLSMRVVISAPAMYCVSEGTAALARLRFISGRWRSGPHGEQNAIKSGELASLFTSVIPACHFGL